MATATATATAAAMVMLLGVLLPVVMCSASPTATTAAAPSAASTTTPRHIRVPRVMLIVVAIHRFVVVPRTPVSGSERAVSEARAWLPRVVLHLVVVVVPDAATSDHLGVWQTTCRVVEAENFVALDAYSQRQTGNLLAVDWTRLTTVTSRARACHQLSQHLVVHLHHVTTGTCGVYVTAGHHLQTSSVARLSINLMTAK